MTYGLGNLGPRSVEQLVLEFIRTDLQDTDLTVAKLARALFKFISSAYAAQMEGVPKEERPEMGLFVAGYSDDSPFAQEWEFLLPRDKKASEVKAAEESGSAWRGINVPFIRLWSGYDPGIHARLQEADVDEDVMRKRSGQPRHTPSTTGCRCRTPSTLQCSS
jgi:hypothetical protein